MERYGLDAGALVREIEVLLDVDLNINAYDLTAVRLEEVHSAAKAEAL